jgi:O-antigen/teichoic acid export membrane protein
LFLQRNDAWEDLLSLRLFVSGILVLGSCAILFLLPQGSSQGYTPLVRIGIILFTPSIVFTALTTTGNALFQKYLRYDLSTIAVIAGSLVSLLLVGVITTAPYINQSIIYATTALLVGGAVTAGVALFLTRTLERTAHSTIFFPRLWSLFCASIPLGLTLLFNLVYFRIDSIILTVTRSTAEVGVYGLAYKVFELPLILPTFFMNSLYPILLSQSRDSLKKTIHTSTVVLFFSSLVVVGCLWICAPLVTIIKTDFAASISALRVLSLGLPFFFLSSLTMWILIAQKKQKILVGIYGASMVVNICLNYFFIPTYGYMAAAWITVVSEALVLCISLLTVVYLFAKNK